MPIEKENLDIFTDIGKKIKGMARTIALIEIINSYILAIVIFILSFFDFEALWWLLLVSFVVIVLGYSIAWASSYLLYGFGELIDKTCEIEKNTRGNRNEIIAQPSPKKEKVETVAKPKGVKVATTTFTLDESTCFADVTCPECGENLSFVENTKEAECPFCGALFRIELHQSKN